MAIPESRLEIWSHQGAITTSKDTYATVKRALEGPNSKYAKRQFEVFLQGSCANDTNIHTESDVDIVICYNDAFFMT
jgi:tRNA nucleotidyltransferase (CCA-adding enzyme)